MIKTTSSVLQNNITALTVVSIIAGSIYFSSHFEFRADISGPKIDVSHGLTHVADFQEATQQDASPSKASEQPMGVALERAWPSLRFERPVHLCGAADGTNRVFVVEQNGIVRVFQNGSDETKTSEVFLDIRDQVSRLGNEEGLIGFAFHPDYKNNGQFFVHYSSSKNDPFGTVSRFQVSEDNPNRAIRESEKIVFEIEQPFRNHNGGTIAFGNDGFLYLTLGDGGKANDPLGSGQDLGSLLGKILRIDVDGEPAEGMTYAIPEDNPFVDRDDAEPEIWALGLRNVWRFSFDRKTGELWAGDVGQDKWDEVSLVTKGANYGWNRFEAENDFAVDTKMATPKHTVPVASYGREWGISITGGNVYRGKRFPVLDGRYFYGDYVSGNMWQITRDSDGEFENELVRRTGRSIAAFGEDDAGELFVLSFDGGIYRIVPTAEPENMFVDWPEKLSDTGFFESLKERKTSEQLVRYDVNAPFWSDHADKDRYFMLPEGKKIEYREEGAWSVPIGTTIVKNFSRYNKRKMLETRVIRRTESGWESATYVWNNRGDDATLHPEGQQFEMYSRGKKGNWVVDVWHAPSSSECASCHVDAAGYVLGLNTLQLNRNGFESDRNQITTWLEQGLLALPEGFDVALDVGKASSFCSPFDETKPIEERARVWLDVNCAMCHRPDGPGNANIDLRYATNIADTKMIGEKPAQGDLGIEGAELIKVGDPASSLMLHRIETLGAGRMPNVGSSIVDEKAVELLKKWIRELRPNEDD